MLTSLIALVEAAAAWHRAGPHSRSGRLDSHVLADWTAHLSVVRDTAVALPERLAALLVEITERLTAAGAHAPLAAMRAVGVLERVAARVGREAAGVLVDGGVSAEAVAAGSGPPAPRP